MEMTEDVSFWDLTERGQVIALALSALGTRASNRHAAAIDAALPTPLTSVQEVRTIISIYLDEHYITPGLNDNGHGSLVQSDVDMAAYITGRLGR